MIINIERLLVRITKMYTVVLNFGGSNSRNTQLFIHIYFVSV